MNKIIKKIAVIAIITLAVGVSLMLIGNKMRADAIKEQREEEQYYNWLVENCECLEKERIFCSEGAVLKGVFCYNVVQNSSSNRLIGCSKYKCSAGITNWNNEAGKWGELQ